MRLLIKKISRTETLLALPVKIGNNSCEIFTNIGQNLAGKFPNTHVSYRTFLQNGIS